MFWELPSEYKPFAVSWSSWVAFSAIAGLAGVTVIETNPGTLMVAEPVTLPAVAEMVEVPILSALANPALPTALLILTALGEDEFQITD